MPGSIHRGHADKEVSVAFTYKDVWLKAALVTSHNLPRVLEKQSDGTRYVHPTTLTEPYQNSTTLNPTNT